MVPFFVEVPLFDNNNLLRKLAILVFLVLMGGTVGYTLVEEGWTLFDGFYMTLITLTTIGFGEVHTMTTAGRVLTVLIIVFGLGSAATILTQLGQLMMQGNRRITDVMGFELQVYRNFSKGGTTIREISERTQALRIVAHID